MAGYSFRGFSIPARMKERLDSYIQNREPVGGFLAAVISNDLFNACSRADDHNITNLPAYTAYLYNEAPSECWGSPEKYRAWIGGEK